MTDRPRNSSRQTVPVRTNAALPAWGGRRALLVLREAGEQVGDLAEASTAVAVYSPQLRVRLESVVYGASGIALVEQHGRFAQRPQLLDPLRIDGQRVQSGIHQPPQMSSTALGVSRLGEQQRDDGVPAGECSAHSAISAGNLPIARESWRSRAILNRSDQAIISALVL